MTAGLPGRRRQGLLPGRRRSCRWSRRAAPGAGRQPQRGRRGRWPVRCSRCRLRSPGPALRAGASCCDYADSFYAASATTSPRRSAGPGTPPRCGPSSPTSRTARWSSPATTARPAPFEWYGVGAPVYSGHNGWRDWGPPPDGTGPVVVVFYRDPAVDFTGCERAATLHNDVGIDNEEEGQGVWVCDAPIGSWSSAVVGAVALRRLTSALVAADSCAGRTASAASFPWAPAPRPSGTRRYRGP